MAKRRKPSLRERLQNEKARRARENRLHNHLDYGQLEPRKLMALVWGVGDVGSNRPTGEGSPIDGFIQFNRDDTIGSLTINFTIESTASIPGKRWAGSNDCQTIGSTATFNPGSNVAYVYFKAFDDLIYEGTENLRLKLEPGNGYTVDNRPQIARYLFSETTIADNDPAIADVSVSTTDSQASEHPNNSETGTLLFTRSGGELGQALTVNIQTVSGINPAKPEDYSLTVTPTNSTIQATSTGWSLTFPANVSAVTVKLQPVDDSLVEETEFARFKLATGTGYNIVTPGNQEITIYDNEPTVTVITADAIAKENSLDNAAFRFDRTNTNASSVPLTVIFSVSGKAVLNSDYRFESTYSPINFVGSNQFSITINAQDGYPLSEWLYVIPINDSEMEGAEDVIVSIQQTYAGNGYRIGTPSSATAEIYDDDRPTISVAAIDPLAAETGPDTGVYRFYRTNEGIDQALTVSFDLTGTASKVTDYTLASYVQVTFPAYESFVYSTLTPINDNLNEGPIPETAILTLKPQIPSLPPDHPRQKYIVNTSPAVINIDDFVLPVVDISSSGVASETGPTRGIYTFTRTGGNLNASLTVPFAIEHANCASPNDYVLSRLSSLGEFDSANSRITFAANQTTFQLSLMPVDDRVDEKDTERVRLTIAKGTGYQLPNNAATKSADITITDNDTIGRPSITLATPNNLRVVELPTATQTGSLRFDFSFPTHAAERYEVIFKRHSLVNSVDTWTTIGNYETGVYNPSGINSKEYTNLKAGLYAFSVRGKSSCPSNEVVGEWRTMTAAIVENGDLNLDNIFQRNNYEQTCGCDSLPPGEDLAGARVVNDTGDMVLPFANIANAPSGTLSSYVYPTYVSGGQNRLKFDATFPLPTAPISMQASVIVKGHDGSELGRIEITPNTATLDDIKERKIFNVIGDLTELKDANGQRVELPSGSYLAFAKIKAIFPDSFAEDPTSDPEEPYGKVNLEFVTATTEVNYLRAEDRIFGKGLSLQGHSQLIVDGGGVTLFRGNGTSVRFASSGSGYTTPPGSYITVTKGIFSIADPLGGPTREATYMLRSISGATSYYDTDGRLLQRGAFPGDQLQFYYAGPTPNKLSRIYCDNTKQKIDYLYTGDKITQVVDWVGRSWTYEYAANGTLAAFGPTSGSNSLPTARVLLSFTDGAPKLTQLQVIDPLNTSQFTSFSWDAAHNVKSVTQAGRTMNVLSPETRHDSSLRLVDEGGEFDPQDTWGRFNFPDSSQATFSADPFGNRTREERSVMGFNPATGQTGKIQTVYSWTTRDLNGQATGPNTRQQVNLMGYGSSQNSTAALPSNQYDNLGRLIETSYPDGTSERWGFEPSATANKPSTYIDRGNRVFFYSYQSGRFPTTVVMKALPDPWGAPLSGPTDPRLQTVSVTNYTYLHGRIKTITESDPNGNGGYGLGIEFYYDRNLNPIHKRTTTVDPFGTPTPASVNDAWESYGYDQNQNLVWLTSKYLPTTLHQFQLPGGISIGDVPYGNDPKLVEVRTDLSVDAMGRVLSATAPAPQAGGARQTASWTYDLSGRPLSETTTDTNGAARAIKFAYNGNGELIRIDSPDPDWSGPLEPSAELFTRDSNGLITEIRKLNGGIPASLRQFRFDSFGRLLAESMELPGAAGTFGRYEATYREYDALNRVLRVEQPVGKAGSNEPKYLITSAQFSDSTRSVTTSFSAQGIDGPNQDDIIEKFDPLGRKVQTSQGALKQEYLWLDGNTWEGVRGTLLRTTDERGVFAWTKFGPTGKVVRLQSADPDGTGPLLPLNRRYRYDARGNSLSETEFSGGLSRTSSFTFDFRDLLTSQTSVDGRTTTFEYDLLQRSRKETSPTGATIERQYRVDGLLSRMDRSDLDPNTPDYFETYQYDNLSRLIGSTTPDGTSRLTFNAIGKLASTQSPDPDGAGPLQPLTVNWQYALSKAGLFVSETSDGDGSQTKFDFDSAGRLLAQYRPRSVNPSGMDFSNVYGAANGGASATASERWEYDAAGKLLREFSAKAIGEAGENLVTYQYDRLGRLTSRGDTVRREQFEYSAANGDLLAATDVLGRRTVFTAYDNLGRLLASQRQFNGQGYDTTRVQYDPLGRVASSTALSGESGKEQLTQFQYNLADQLTAQIDALGNSKSYQYNPASGFLTASTNEQGLQQFFAYDRLGRVTASWTTGFSESSGSTRNQYDAMDRVVTSTDPLNNVSSYKFDSLGRIVEQTDPRGPGVNSITRFAYGQDGNLASLTDPVGNVTKYRYDHRDRLREDEITVNGTAAIRAYWYQPNDNLSWSRDRNERWTKFDQRFAYGAENNHIQTKETWWVSATSNNNLINYSYDDQQGKGLLVTEVTDQRNLATSPNITSRIEFAYDGLGRLVRQVDWLTPKSKATGFELKYQYGDKLDRRTQTEGNFIGLTATGGYLSSQPDFRNEYQWDRLNRVTKVTQNVLGSTMAGSMATVRNVDLAYYADGHLKEISRTQGTGTGSTRPIRTAISRVANGQKNEGRISSIQHTGLAGPGSAANYSYEYDDHGRLKTFTTPAGPRTYAYDSFDQITQVDWTNQNAETYQYDANGNRTGTNRTTEANNRVREDQHYWYAYDEEGNRTYRFSKANSQQEFYKYDYRNRLVSVSRYTPAKALIQKVEYQYDGIDRRIRRTVTNADGTVVEQQRFLYDQNIGDSQFEEAVLVLDELSGSTPSSQVQHRYLNGVLVDQVFADENSLGKVLWYLQDDLQTVRDVAVYESGMPNEFAKVRNHLEYDSFGKLLDADDRQTVAQGDGDRPGNQGAGQEYSPQRSYTGREPDPATGLVYYRARWYDPQLGRFISEDPLGFAAGDTNLSRYVGNSATNAVDPSGLRKAPNIPDDGLQANAVNIGSSGQKETAEMAQAKTKIIAWQTQHLAALEQLSRVLSAPVSQGLGNQTEIIAGLETYQPNAKHGNIGRCIEFHEVGKEGSFIYSEWDTYWLPLTFSNGFFYCEAETGREVRIPYDAHDPESKDIALQMILRARNIDALEKLQKDLATAIVTAPENAIRTAFPSLDTVLSAGETAGALYKTAKNYTENGEFNRGGLLQAGLFFAPFYRKNPFWGPRLSLDDAIARGDHGAIARIGVQNPNSVSVVLGKWIEEGKPNANLSYEKIAKQMNSTYLKFDESDFKKVGAAFNRDDQHWERWRINEFFLREQIRRGKSIYLCSNPDKATGYFFLEVNILKAFDYTFIKTQDNLWEAVYIGPNKTGKPF